MSDKEENTGGSTTGRHDDETSNKETKGQPQYSSDARSSSNPSPSSDSDPLVHLTDMPPTLRNRVVPESPPRYRLSSVSRSISRARHPTLHERHEEEIRPSSAIATSRSTPTEHFTERIIENDVGDEEGVVSTEHDDNGGEDESEDEYYSDDRGDIQSAPRHYSTSPEPSDVRHSGRRASNEPKTVTFASPSSGVRARRSKLRHQGHVSTTSTFTGTAGPNDSSTSGFQPSSPSQLRPIEDPSTLRRQSSSSRSSSSQSSSSQSSSSQSPSSPIEGPSTLRRQSSSSQSPSNRSSRSTTVSPQAGANTISWSSWVKRTLAKLCLYFIGGLVIMRFVLIFVDLVVLAACPALVTSFVSASMEFICHSKPLDSTVCPSLCLYTNLPSLLPTICNTAQPAEEYKTIIPDINNEIAAALASNNVLYTHDAPRKFALYHNSIHEFRTKLVFAHSQYQAANQDPCYDIENAIGEADELFKISHAFPLSLQRFLTNLGTTASLTLSANWHTLANLRLARSQPPKELDFAARVRAAYHGGATDAEIAIRNSIVYHISSVHSLISASLDASRIIQADFNTYINLVRQLHSRLMNGQQTCGQTKGNGMSRYGPPVRIFAQLGGPVPKELAMVSKNLEVMLEILDWIDEQKEFLNTIELALARVDAKLLDFQAIIANGGILVYRTVSGEGIGDPAAALDHVIRVIDEGAVSLKENFDNFKVVEKDHRLGSRSIQKERCW